MIDISPARRRGTTTAAPAAELDRACRDIGFFLVTGHGVARRPARRPRPRRPRVLRPTRGRRRPRSPWPAAGGPGGAGSPRAASSPPGDPTTRRASTSAPSSAADDPRVAGRRPAARPQPVPRRPARAARRGARLDRRDDRASATPGPRHRRSASGSTPTGSTEHLTADPTVLFRIFRYPPAAADDDGWGVGEHTDYGLLTILAQDGTPGLAGARSGGAGSTCPPVPGHVRGATSATCSSA